MSDETFFCRKLFATVNEVKTLKVLAWSYIIGQALFPYVTAQPMEHHVLSAIISW